MLNNYKFFKTKDGTELRTRPIEKNHNVWLVAIHGIGEHLDRHNYLPDLFGHKLNVLQFDLRGHGRSGGQRAYVESFDDYVADLRELLNCLKKTYKMEKFILFGHSMGGLIASNYIKNIKTGDPYPIALILSSPPVQIGGVLGKALSYLPSKIFSKALAIGPSVALGGIVNLDNLSSDARVKDDYLRDELNALKLHSKLLINMVNSSREVYSSPLRCKVPLYCSVGKNDVIVSVDAIKEYFGSVELGGQVTLFEGGRHELHNEIDKIKSKYFSYLANIIDMIVD